mmetsp:Transcript_30732/g.67402  ORF Transcript_30732/g.67402 Transcript_30732/m.67402 type:complete len:127 (-) Transcript_30732:125-505(-)
MRSCVRSASVFVGHQWWRRGQYRPLQVCGANLGTLELLRIGGHRNGRRVICFSGTGVVWIRLLGVILFLLGDLAALVRGIIPARADRPDPQAETRLRFMTLRVFNRRGLLWFHFSQQPRDAELALR